MFSCFKMPEYTCAKFAGAFFGAENIALSADTVLVSVSVILPLALICAAGLAAIIRGKRSRKPEIAV